MNRDRTFSRQTIAVTVVDPLERLVMEYAEAMTETPPIVDDEQGARP